MTTILDKRTVGNLQKNPKILERRAIIRYCKKSTARKVTERLKGWKHMGSKERIKRSERRATELDSQVRIWFSQPLQLPISY